jgi:uncharacterized protein YwgA
MSDLDKVIAFLKELGLTPNVDSFEDKLKIQKIVCLLELMGEDISYKCSLYIRGPYSPGLTKDLYENRKEVESLKTSYTLSSEDIEKAVRIKEATADGLDSKMLEIISTYLFLERKLNKDYKNALIELKKLKPFYSDIQIAVGVSRSKLLFPIKKSDLESMKAEFKDWEEASDSDFKD